ncbi:MAG: hypothetical protein L0H79_20780 [Intrasporangium sp.]|uniref:thermonuclease family protein n=1 Tax=Intrasporangium sp. TaxID=1925024 RepID=UPI0026495027|nr:hypothetical protein [Intrasporangium sp.]MDN5798162.1 hypothetical protein [Intrasporangium sp.]
MTRTHAAAAAAFTALALAGCAPGADPAPSTLTPAGTPTAATVTIARVLDGDTVDVRQAERTERVRLLGIDAPETEHGQQPAQCGAGHATGALRDLLGRGQVAAREEHRNGNVR